MSDLAKKDTSEQFTHTQIFLEQVGPYVINGKTYRARYDYKVAAIMYIQTHGITDYTIKGIKEIDRGKLCYGYAFHFTNQDDAKKFIVGFHGLDNPSKIKTGTNITTSAPQKLPPSPQ
jgi:hypothetical protein